MQKVWPKDEQGDLWLKDKIDAANLEQKHSSHGVDWDGSRLSFGLWIGRTIVLEGLGSKNQLCTYLLCKWHNAAEGVCAVVWLVHGSPMHDILQSSIIH